MKTSMSGMSQAVKEQVLRSTNRVNTVIFIYSIINGFLFWYYEATAMFWYNALLTLAFVYACISLKRGKAVRYVSIVFSGLFLFMVLAVIFLGWEFGFQQYCISIAASLIFSDYYLYRERKLPKRSIFAAAAVVMIYMGLRMWTYHCPYVYYIDNAIVVRSFYLLNSIVGLSFMIVYLCIYSNTVRRLEFELLDMANLDPLTGISNRRKMHETLKLAFGREDKCTAAIAMLDVDYFKNVNDTYGHDAGDEVLITLARILDSRHKADEDFHACRWGGEEFLVLCEYHDKGIDDIVQKFEEIRQAVQNTVVTHKDTEIRITVTVGLAFYQDGMTIQQLINTADDNLYKGKQEGRNKVVY